MASLQSASSQADRPLSLASQLPQVFVVVFVSAVVAHQLSDPVIRRQHRRPIAPGIFGLIQRRIRALDKQFNTVIAAGDKRVAAQTDRQITGGRTTVGEMRLSITLRRIWPAIANAPLMSVSGNKTANSSPP